MTDNPVQGKLKERLLRGSATSLKLAETLGISEAVVLGVLDNMRKNRLVQFAGGEWSISEE